MIRRIVAAVSLCLLFTSQVRGAEAPSYAQPAHALVMPFDVTPGRVSFLQVSRVDDSDERIATHWVFWSDGGALLAEFVTCLDPNETILVDPVSLPGDGAPSLRGERGLVTATAYGGAVECGSADGRPFEAALAGSFTLADVASGSAFGHDALGFARSADDTHVDLPVSRSVAVSQELAVQAFAPGRLDFSLLILMGVRERGGTQRFPGELGPLLDVRGSTSAVMSLGSSEDLTRIVFSGALFAPLDETGLAVPEDRVRSASLLVFSDLTAGGRPVDGDTGDDNTRVFGLLGQSIGSFGTSTRLRTRGRVPEDGIVPVAVPTPTAVLATPSPSATPGSSPSPPPTIVFSTPTPVASRTPAGFPTATPVSPPPSTPPGPTPPAAPTATPFVSPIPTATAVASHACPEGRRSVEVVVAATRTIAGVELRIRYPASLSVPGEAADSTVLERISWVGVSSGALRAANDRGGLLHLAIAAREGGLARDVKLLLDFDCPTGALPVDELPECVARAVDTEGVHVDAVCTPRVPDG